MNSLLVRFFLFSLVIAGCSIAVTAWLASQATTGTIRQEQGEALETDAQILDEVVGYAATHADWSQAKSEMDRISQKHGRRIALTDQNGKKLLDTGGANAPQPPITPRAIVDPLNVDGKIIKTNAPYVKGSDVTLLQLDFDKLLADEAALTKLQGATDMKSLASVPGLKVIPEKRVTIEFGK